MSTIRFPNDNLAKKLMKQQDDFWRVRDKKRSLVRDEKLGVTSNRGKGWGK